MNSSDPSRQAELDFTDFAYADRVNVSEDASGNDLPPEDLSPEIRAAVAKGLAQVRAGEFADSKAIRAILRRAGA